MEVSFVAWELQYESTKMKTMFEWAAILPLIKTCAGGTTGHLGFCQEEKKRKRRPEMHMLYKSQSR